MLIKLAGVDNLASSFDDSPTDCLDIMNLPLTRWAHPAIYTDVVNSEVMDLYPHASPY